MFYDHFSARSLLAKLGRGFCAPLEQYVQQEQQQQRYRESQQSFTTKTTAEAQRQKKWVSKPGVNCY